jgi:AcrR family transcriptional regulator
VERAQALEEAVTTGPPPLGPGAPDRDRLLAFLDAIIEVVSRNKSLLAELAYSAAAEPPSGAEAAFAGGDNASPDRDQHQGRDQHQNRDQDDHPVYRFWHGHISALIAAQRPDVDAELIAHLMLGALHSEPIMAQLAAGEPKRLIAAIRTLACSVLDAPPAT